MAGKITFQVTGFFTTYNAVNYWVILENGTSGTNLPLNPRYSPGGVSVCSPSIEGYSIIAMTKGCAYGTYSGPTPEQPTTSVASKWTLSVANSDILVRTPTFLISGFEITNPSELTPMNTYIFSATDMLYGYWEPWTGRIAGVYTSSHYPVSFKWSLLGNEITSSEG